MSGRRRQDDKIGGANRFQSGKASAREKRSRKLPRTNRYLSAPQVRSSARPRPAAFVLEIAFRLEALPGSLSAVSGASSSLLRLENPQCLFIVTRRLFWLLLRREHSRQPRVGFGEIGVDAERCLEMFSRFAELSLFSKGNSQIVRGSSVAGLEFHYPAQIRRGLPQIAALRRDHCKTIVIIRVRRINFNSSLQVLCGAVHVAAI